MPERDLGQQWSELIEENRLARRGPRCSSPSCGQPLLRRVRDRR